MDIACRQAILDFERYFPARYAQPLKKEWGYLFYNRYNPLSHDSNHAVITRPPEDVNAMVTEIIGFYRSKGITPMIYSAFLPDEPPWLRPALIQAGFTVEVQPDICMLWTADSEAAPRPGIAVREEKEVSSQIADMILSDEGGEWTVKALGGIAGSPHCHIFAAYEGKTPVSMGVLQVGARAMRVDDVLTRPEHRGRGYATAVMDAIVARYRQRYAGRPLYLWTDNPAAARIYHRMGFREIELGATNWHAWVKRSASK